VGQWVNKGQRMSSPRERGSSEGRRANQRRLRVVPARAGVIRARSVMAAAPAGRPRASGGHPDSLASLDKEGSSSPRERGSSWNGLVGCREEEVVPARAGVILSRSLSAAITACRPRASGGHPNAIKQQMVLRKSSPRERGSSSGLRSPSTSGIVVPARAGVIRGSRCCTGRSTRRPRASGGHPPHTPRTRTAPPSSPRERGSSYVPHPVGGVGLVVPARAGVIRFPARM